MLKDSYYIRSLLLTALAMAGFLAVLAGFIYLAGYWALCVIAAAVLLGFTWFYKPWQRLSGVSSPISRINKEDGLKDIIIHSPEKQATKAKG